MKTITRVSFGGLLKTCVFFALSIMTFGAFASTLYVGNPHRPNTIWVPGHCSHGCWAEGHYLKFIDPATCPPGFTWISGRYDRHGNYIEGHYRYNAPVYVVNEF